MALLTRQEILEASDKTSEIIDVPSWGGEVRVQAIMSHDRDKFEREYLDASNIRASLVARCVVDANGDRLFTDADVELLGERSAEAMDAVYNVCLRLNGMGADDVAELEGN